MAKVAAAVTMTSRPWENEQFFSTAGSGCSSDVETVYGLGSSSDSECFSVSSVQCELKRSRAAAHGQQLDAYCSLQAMNYD